MDYLMTLLFKRRFSYFDVLSIWVSVLLIPIHFEKTWLGITVGMGTLVVLSCFSVLMEEKFVSNVDEWAKNARDRL